MCVAVLAEARTAARVAVIRWVKPGCRWTRIRVTMKQRLLVSASALTVWHHQRHRTTPVATRRSHRACPRLSGQCRDASRHCQQMGPSRPSGGHTQLCSSMVTRPPWPRRLCEWVAAASMPRMTVVTKRTTTRGAMRVWHRLTREL